MNAEVMKRRTKAFALRIIKLVQSMPKTTEGRALAQQIVKSGTSVGANYRSACRARSRAEFAAKLGISLEEADETAWWLELIIEAEVMPRHLLEPLLSEANELTAILNQARMSARKPKRAS